MSAALAIGFATTGATLLVTVFLFSLDRVLARRAAQQEVRRQLMVRVLDTLDALIRFMIRPAFVSVWTNPQIEYTLLMPRLLLDLGREDRMLAAWVQRQIQLMQLATSKKEAVRIRASVAEKLLGWHLGEINTAWFADQVRNDPAAVKLEIPLRAKAKQLSNDAWAWAQLFAALAAVGLMFRQVFKPSNDA